MTNNIFTYEGILNSLTLDEFLQKFKLRQDFTANDYQQIYDVNLENIKKWISNPHNNGILPNFKYFHNKNGFRDSDENFDSDILCFGCSVTYGVGVPETHRWTDILKKELNVKLNNLGVPGLSLTDILILYLGITKFVKPKYCIFLIPDFRREIFSKINDITGDFYFFNGFDNYKISWNQTKFPVEYNICKNYYSIPISYHIDKFVNSVHTLLMFAENHNTKIILGSWCSSTDQILRNIKINNFKNSALLRHIKTDKLGRDLVHCGIQYHARVAAEIKIIIKSYENKGEIAI